METCAANFAHKLPTLLRSILGVEMDGAPGLSYARNPDTSSSQWNWVRSPELAADAITVDGQLSVVGGQ